LVAKENPKHRVLCKQQVISIFGTTPDDTDLKVTTVLPALFDPVQISVIVSSAVMFWVLPNFPQLLSPAPLKKRFRTPQTAPI
jgi:hypothetical protein